MMATMLVWMSYGLILIGMLCLSVAVYGMIWMPGVYLKLHAVSLTAIAGVIPILIGLAILSGEAAIILRAIVIAAFLLLTVPVSAHAMGYAAYRVEE